jgi:hypothetical protein
MSRSPEIEHNRYQAASLQEQVVAENFAPDGDEAYLMLALDPPIAIYVETNAGEIDEELLDVARDIVACLNDLDNELQHAFFKEWTEARRGPFERENRLDRIQVSIDRATFHYSGQQFMAGGLMPVVWEEEFHRTKPGRWVQISHRPIY